MSNQRARPTPGRILRRYLSSPVTTSFARAEQFSTLLLPLPSAKAGLMVCLLATETDAVLRRAQNLILVRLRFGLNHHSRTYRETMVAP